VSLHILLIKTGTCIRKSLGFFPSKGHAGDDIGKQLESCLASWGIDKVFTIAVDNANANNNAINYMRRVLNESKGTFAEGEYLHMRCVAHIINLIVNEGLKEIDNLFLVFVLLSSTSKVGHLG
jgi:hypothetical protein